MKLETAINNAYLNLKNNNIKSPLLDCELLMSNVINKKREFIILNLNEQINEDSYIYFKKLISERLKGKPTAYLIEKKSFLEI